MNMAGEQMAISRNFETIRNSSRRVKEGTCEVAMTLQGKAPKPMTCSAVEMVYF
jgi:hypothetical protein